MTRFRDSEEIILTMPNHSPTKTHLTFGIMEIVSKEAIKFLPHVNNPIKDRRLTFSNRQSVVSGETRESLLSISGGLDG